MTATGPAFDPARSAILRDILHETVAHAPTKPSRTRFAIVGALVGAAVLLAGGTAALALSGALHFGSQEPAPLPAPTPSTTSTPTPTPTPTPTSSTRPIAVQTTPIEWHDVAEPAAAPWSLDLPGTGRKCEQHHVYDIADGLALVQLGAHVVGDGSPDCVDDLQHVSLSLVDTQRGRALWTREWTWHAQPEYDVDVIVLGTSGRVLVADQVLGGGPHDVLDLATGRTLADFAGQKNDVTLNAVAVPGDSGDVIMTTPNAIVRADPRDMRSPRWSTTIPGKSAWVYPLSGATDFLPVSILLNTPGPDGGPYGADRVDLQTGRLDPGWSNNALVRTAPHLAVVTAYDSGRPTVLSGLDASGGTTWTRQLPPDADVRAVHSLAGVPGGDVNNPAVTDLIAVITSSELTLLDAGSGEARWSAPATRCGLTGSPGLGWVVTDAFLDPAHDTFTLVHDSAKTCTFAASTGAPHPVPDVPSGTIMFFGPANTYVTSLLPPNLVLTAYDRQSGSKLWSTTTRDSGRFAVWSFAGGYLVRLDGDRLEGLG
ncbi:PQQ-binding-like beta-propeller repeat protein [Leifsonia sp. EB34]|uniref:PQQ-binding-like beta-propeller repeat protein n=1 Tax=Leifsonia sp. EB34 TaxID=3156303 RepID=UPI00351767D7